MARLKVSDVLTTQDKFEEIYRSIGIHFINNAERLGRNVIDATSNVDIFIKLEPNSIVTIDISQSEILRKEELLERPSIDVNHVIERFEKN